MFDEKVAVSASRPLICSPARLLIEPYYTDGQITIYNADCAQVLPFLEPFDLLLTDPPYGINENSKKQQSRSVLAKQRNYGVYDWDKLAPSG